MLVISTVAIANHISELAIKPFHAIEVGINLPFFGWLS
jgi:hypothetical protein